MSKRLVVFCQVVLAVIYLSAGLSKLFHDVPNIIGPVQLIDELAKHNLALFGYFIALMQAVVGALLLSQRFRLIAALMLLPMHICITIIPISLGWHGTPWVNTVLLLMLFTLLYDDRTRLEGLVRADAKLGISSEKTLYWSTFMLCCGLAFYLKYGWSV